VRCCSNYFLLNLQTRRILLLVTDVQDEGINLVFSPDGTRLAYREFEVGVGYAVKLVSIDGTKSTTVLHLTTRGYKSIVDWTPDGEALVMLMSNEPYNYDYYLLSLTGELEKIALPSSQAEQLG